MANGRNEGEVAEQGSVPRLVDIWVGVDVSREELERAQPAKGPLLEVLRVDEVLVRFDAVHAQPDEVGQEPAQVLYQARRKLEVVDVDALTCSERELASAAGEGSEREWKSDRTFARLELLPVSPELPPAR